MEKEAPYKELINPPTKKVFFDLPESTGDHFLLMPLSLSNRITLFL